MKRLASVAILLATTSPLCAQTAVGVGVAKSDSTSVAGAKSTAIGGGQGIGTGGNPTAAVTLNGTPAVTTQNVVTSGTSTVKNVPSVFAPGLAAAGLETCLGSVSGGGSFVGTGFSFGSTIPDPGCAARLDARTLWSMGLKGAAVARLCLNPEINRSMPDICAQYLPQPSQGTYGLVSGPVVSPSYYYQPGTYHGGLIMLTDGKTGQERLCQNYDEPRHRCRHWDGDVVKPRKVAAVKSAASPLSAPEVKQEQKELEGTSK